MDEVRALALKLAHEQEMQHCPDINPRDVLRRAEISARFLDGVPLDAPDPGTPPHYAWRGITYSKPFTKAKSES